ncbi:hypothetical protein D3C81_1046290 [compost metagenome]
MAAQQLIDQNRRQIPLERQHQFLVGQIGEALHRRIPADQPDDSPYRHVQQLHRLAAPGHQRRQVDRCRAVVDFVLGQQYAQLIGVLPQAELNALRLIFQRPALDHVQQWKADHSGGTSQSQYGFLRFDRRSSECAEYCQPEGGRQCDGLMIAIHANKSYLHSHIIAASAPATNDKC